MPRNACARCHLVQFKTEFATECPATAQQPWIAMERHLHTCPDGRGRYRLPSDP